MIEFMAYAVERMRYAGCDMLDVICWPLLVQAVF